MEEKNGILTDEDVTKSDLEQVAEAQEDVSADDFSEAVGMKTEADSFNGTQIQDNNFSSSFNQTDNQFASTKKSFDWPKGLKVFSWIMAALIVVYYIYAIYMSAQSYGMNIQTVLLYGGFAIFYGCLALFGIHSVAIIAEESKKNSEYLEKLTAMKEKELNL